MAYATTNPPMKVSVGPLTDFGSGFGGGGSMWFYRSADLIATVAGAAYFSNGIQLGMQPGDIVFVYDTTTPKLSIAFVISTAVGTTPGTGSATLNSTTFATAT